MPSNGLGAYSVKINQIIFGGLFVGVMLLGIKATMWGDMTRLKTLAVLSLAVALVLSLDKYYWLICPVLFMLGWQIPGVPFNGQELGCISLITVYFIRQAMHKEHAFRVTAEIVLAFSFFIWIVFVWMLNPTGLAMLGASSIGARFYMKILLGFLAYLVLSTLSLSEKDCKILFRCLFLCSFVVFFKTLLSSEITQMNAGEDESIQSGSKYELLGAMSLYVFMFSRFSISKILTSPKNFIFTAACVVLTIYSGKRQGIGTIFLVPILRAFFTWRNKMATVCSAIITAMILGIIISGHGTYYEIPVSAQRALAVVVPSFANSTAGGTSDLFRKEVHRYALDIIKRSPWVGRGGFAMDRAETSWVVFGSTGSSFAGHAFAGNWHGTWYAFAADFGIPAAVLWGVFLLYALSSTYKGFRTEKFGEYSLAVYMYFALSLFLIAIFSWTSGHSALTPLSTWYTCGMILALRNGLKSRSLNQLGSTT